eukprot:jgi/Astpho2/9600/gw1.00146.153.1_t
MHPLWSPVSTRSTCIIMLCKSWTTQRPRFTRIFRVATNLSTRAGGRVACWSIAMLGNLGPPRLSLRTY